MVMIDEKTLESILSLSRFEVGEAEKERFRSQVADILYYFDLLAKIDTARVDQDLGTVVDSEDLRRDQVREGLSGKQLRSFAVKFREGHFAVPRILDEGR